jgi:hypothetical protein
MYNPCYRVGEQARESEAAWRRSRELIALGASSPSGDAGQKMIETNEIRMDVLRRLAEQAMSDPDFRDVARHDLATALNRYGYDLNEREMALVLRFRDALEEAGVDLWLGRTDKLSEADLELIRQF